MNAFIVLFCVVSVQMAMAGNENWATFPSFQDAYKTSIGTCLRDKLAKGIPASRRVYSQYEEDGVLEAIFSCIGTTNKKYVEFGTEACSECSTRWLREHYNFTGLLLDGNHDNPKITYTELIYAHNIAELFKKYKVETMVDHLTIDIDLNTFWVAHKLLHAGYRSRVLIMEINRGFKLDEAYTTIHMPEEMWRGTCYFGASLLALKRLAGSDRRRQCHEYGNPKVYNTMYSFRVTT